MHADPENPFTAAVQPGADGAGAPNPFQAAAPEAASPFSGVASESPFGLVDEAAGRPAQLPERRPAEQAPPQAAPVNGASPFEAAGHAVAPSPFEPVTTGVPSEGFLAEEPVARAEEAQFVPVSPAPSHPQPPASAPVAQPAGVPDFDPFAPVNPVDTAFVPVSPPPTQPIAEPAPQNEFVAPVQQFAPPQQPAPQPMAVPQPAPAPVAPAGSQVAHAGTPQLVLRAIFGVTGELSKDEILQRARTLPGVRNLQVVGINEANAMRVLRQSVSQMGFGDEHAVSLHSNGGDIDIIEEEGVALAVLHEDSGYAPGVRETLIIVASELARLSV